MKIGVFGGSFDPIHLGHLNLAESLRTKGGLDKVLFLPTYNSYHKPNRNLTSHDVRLRLIRAAISSNPYFELSLIEIERKKPSYTYESYDELKLLYPGDEIYFLGGSDLIFGLDQWAKSEYLLENARFILAYRAGDDRLKVEERLSYLRQEKKARIELVRAPLFELSSTFIRDRIRTNQSVRYMMTEEVERIIREEGLYLE